MSYEFTDRSNKHQEYINERFRYLVTQDQVRQVFEGDSYQDCLDYLKLVMDEQSDYIHRYNERDGTLSLQDPYNGEVITTLRIRIIDLRGRDLSLEGERQYDGLDITRILSTSSRSRRTC